MKSIEKISIDEIIKLMDSVENENIRIEEHKILFNNVNASKFKEGVNKICKMWYHNGTLFFDNKEILFIKETCNDKKFGLLYQYLQHLRTYMIFEYKTKYIENSFIGANI